MSPHWLFTGSVILTGLFFVALWMERPPEAFLAGSIILSTLGVAMEAKP